MSYDQMIRRGRKEPIFTPGAATKEVDLGLPEIKRIIPHREPFLLLDRISAVDPNEQAIRGHRSIDPQDPILAGHFPSDPVYPGVLLVEMIAQTCLCLQRLVVNGEVVVPEEVALPQLRLLKLHHAIFLNEARPGDELTILGKIIEEAGYTAILAGQVMRKETICAYAIQEAYLFTD